MRRISFGLSFLFLLPLSPLVVLAQSQPPCSGSVSITDPTQAQPGVLAVVSNSAQAAFTVSGPATYHGSDYYWVQQGIPAGTYTITWSAVNGCGTPQSETKSTDAKGSVAFAGNYKDLNPSSGYGTLTVKTNLNIPVTITLSGPATKTAKGTGFTWASAPPGTYTVSCGDVEGYNTPKSETETLAPGGSGFFHCNYIPKTSDIQQFTIQSEPVTGVDIYVDGKFVGKAPVRAYVNFGSSAKARCSFAGYEDGIVELDAPTPGSNAIVANLVTHCVLTAKSLPPPPTQPIAPPLAPQEPSTSGIPPANIPSQPVSPSPGFFASIWRTILSIFGIR